MFGCAAFLWLSFGVSLTGESAHAHSERARRVMGDEASRPRDSLVVATFGAMIFSLASLASAGENTGGGKLFVYLGEISYSIYMICIPWKLIYVNLVCRLGGFDKTHLPIVVWLLFLVSVIPLAALSYHLIERPARGFMRRWTPGAPAPLASVA